MRFFLRNIWTLLYKKHPNELKLVLIDPKKVEFSVYSRITNKFMAAVLGKLQLSDHVFGPQGVAAILQN